MANTTQTITAMAMVMLGMAATPAAADRRETIVLSVANQCQIPQSVLDAAQETATSIYEAIGVRLVWLPAGIAVGPELAGAAQFRVTLVAEVAEGRLLSRLRLQKPERDTVLGMARSDARTAFLFCYRIARLAKRSKITALEIALSRALAHEIGHLLLPQIVHSDTGIMRARLDLHHDEAPGFTDEQGESIRTRSSIRR